MARPRALTVAAPARVEGALVHHEATVTAVGIGPDGRLLATGDREGVLHLCDLEFGRHTYSVDMGAPVEAVVATSGVVGVLVGSELALVHGFGGRVVGRVDLGAPGCAVAASPDGMWIAALARDGTLVGVRVATGREKARGLVPGGQALAFQDDRTVLVATEDGPVGVALPRFTPVEGVAWPEDVRDPSTVSVVLHPSGVARVEVSEDGDVWLRLVEQGAR